MSTSDEILNEIENGNAVIIRENGSAPDYNTLLALTSTKPFPLKNLSEKKIRLWSLKILLCDLFDKQLPQKNYI